jgi:membrane-bound serine protease (ClpP class)
MSEPSQVTGWAAVSPDISLCLVIIGILLIYWEFCSPGRIVPGMIGAAMLLSGGWILAQQEPLSPIALILLSLTPVLWVITIINKGTGPVTMCSAVCLCLGVILLIPSPNHVMFWICLPLCVMLDRASLILGRSAWLARQSKAQLDSPEPLSVR